MLLEGNVFDIEYWVGLSHLRLHLLSWEKRVRRQVFRGFLRDRGLILVNAAISQHVRRF